MRTATRDNPLADLTPRERDVLATILHLAHQGSWPSYREIASRLGMRSVAGLSYLLGRLREKGLVEWDPSLARGLRVKGARLVLSFDGSETGKALKRLLRDRG